MHILHPWSDLTLTVEAFNDLQASSSHTDSKPQHVPWFCYWQEPLSLLPLPAFDFPLRLHTLEGFYFWVDSHWWIVCNPHCMFSIVCCAILCCYAVLLQLGASPGVLPYCQVRPCCHRSLLYDMGFSATIGSYKIMYEQLYDLFIHYLWKYELILYVTEKTLVLPNNFTLFCFCL